MGVSTTPAIQTSRMVNEDYLIGGFTEYLGLVLILPECAKNCQVF
jgi:hypothetical protein